MNRLRKTTNTYTSTVRSYATSPWASSAPVKKKRKIVIVGAGFVGSYVAKALVADPRNQVVLASRNPQSLYEKLKPLGSSILPPQSLDITSPSTLSPVFKDADVVVSLVGILTGTPEQFRKVQEEGGDNVARIAKEEGVGRVVVVSALGVDKGGEAYSKTKMAMERSFQTYHPSCTIVRPSLVFGPGDSFFTRFASLAKYLPLLPLFGGGKAKFQPIYVGDLARAIEVCSRDETCDGGKELMKDIEGKIIQGGGPDVFTYKQLMQVTLIYAGLKRLLLPIPFWIGNIQAFFMEILPLPELFKVTRDQVKQLKRDNKEDPSVPDFLNVQGLLRKYPAAGLGTALPSPTLRSVFEIVPMYLKPDGAKGSSDGSTAGAMDAPVSGKRKHGRDYVGVGGGEEEVRNSIGMKNV